MLQLDVVVHMGPVRLHHTRAFILDTLTFGQGRGLSGIFKVCKICLKQFIFPCYPVSEAGSQEDQKAAYVRANWWSRA